MVRVEEWDDPDDKGVILAFEKERLEALLEVYDDDSLRDFSCLSLQLQIWHKFGPHCLKLYTTKAQSQDRGARSISTYEIRTTFCCSVRGRFYCRKSCFTMDSSTPVRRQGR